MNRLYDPTAVEAKWQKAWEEARVFKTDLNKAKNPSSAPSESAAGRPYYSLVMFPYPSGDKLHVGHWYNFAPADSHARFMRMQGHNVFSPMGFDAFGLPAENHAIKKGEHPDGFTDKNVATMITQLKRIGCMYDWDKMVNTSKPEYYRWTQWLFLQMFKNGLAYQKEGNVNYCNSCQTVLANEQCQDGKCERCGTEVIQKPLKQWYWNIKKYSQKLLDGLETLDWPEKTKLMQRNWIGRSEGAEINFDVVGTRRGFIGPMNWSLSSNTLAADLNRQLTQRRTPRIHSRLRTVHLVFTPHGRGMPFEDSASAALILRIIDAVAERHDIVLHEAAAMPDHVHLLISYDSSRNLELDIVKKLKGASAREFLKIDAGDDAHLWGQKKHFVDVVDAQQFESVALYIRQNPQEADLDPDGRILSALPLQISVFTTRQDTLFGATYLVLAPEHPIVHQITTPQQKKKVEEYQLSIAKKTEIERTDQTKMKTGESTGAFAINPVNNEKIPIWIADYALMHYGTGAVMAVPSHDERDFDFAVTYHLAVKLVIQPSPGIANPSHYVYPYDVVRVVAGESIDRGADERDQEDYQLIVQQKKCWTGPGVMINSDFLDGLDVQTAKKKMIEWLEKNKKGKGIINYRLRDWLLSRQRYWGAPIPIVYDPEGNAHPVPEEHLPWKLPTDVEFKPTGKSPLFYSKEFRERTERIFGKGWVPEFDTMDTFVCSSFYYLRYLMQSTDEGDIRRKTKDERKKEASNAVSASLPSSIFHLPSLLVDPALEKKWMPVSMYIGGPEHACMHLIYARFVMMALKDFGFVSHDEPFKKLVHQGLITNKGAKMSKSKGNVVSPDTFVDQYGSDVFRMYLMFMGPFTDGGDWSDTGIRGIVRFVQRIYSTVSENMNKKVDRDSPQVIAALHRTIKKVTEDIQAMRYNTAISALMELLNIIEKEQALSSKFCQTLSLLLAPLAPHLAEELWEYSGGKGFVIDQPWPTHDESLTIESTITVVVQVNGKVRGDMEIPRDLPEADVLKRAKELPNVQKFLTSTIKKEIYVRGKLVSMVV